MRLVHPPQPFDHPNDDPPRAPHSSASGHAGADDGAAHEDDSSDGDVGNDDGSDGDDDVDEADADERSSAGDDTTADDELVGFHALSALAVNSDGDAMPPANTDDDAGGVDVAAAADGASGS